MTFEQFEKSNSAELRSWAKSCFDKSANCPPEEMVSRLSFMMEAQFYMQQLDQRRENWNGRRDLLLEIVVILLIGVEILGIQRLPARKSQEAMGEGGGAIAGSDLRKT